mgnify:FL=1|jgi:hypothetical protein
MQFIEIQTIDDLVMLKRKDTSNQRGSNEEQKVTGTSQTYSTL